jgi:hypothetical protein
MIDLTYIPDTVNDNIFREPLIMFLGKFPKRELDQTPG